LQLDVQIDAEKYSHKEVLELFRPPPSMPERFTRSTLLIGARGSGKTLFLRYQKLQHRGISAYFNLTAEFSSITRQTGFGAIAYDTPPTLLGAIFGKAAALLALSVYAKCIHKKQVPSSRTLQDVVLQCVPSSINSHPDDLSSSSSIDRLRSQLSNAHIELFDGFALDSPLTRVLTEIGRICQGQGKPLLILFDKADQALPDATVPVLETLNQSPTYTAVLAIRPGYTSRELTKACSIVAPGDHFDLHHLGRDPRSKSWLDFQMEAAHSHFRGQDKMPRLLRDKGTLLDTLLFAARDSIRFVIKYLAKDIATKDALQMCLKEEKANLESTASSTLPKNFLRSEDFKGLLSSLQKQTAKETALRPVQIQISKEKKDLYDESENVDRFLEAGLRCGIFGLTDGIPWSPGVQIREVEVSPLLAWTHKSYLPLDRENEEPIVERRNESELRKSYAGSKAPETIFVAYRMDNENSKKFRVQLAEALKRHPDFEKFTVTDGHANYGHKDWPHSVRDKIKRAKMIVGDITGERNEVMVEMGFARGLNTSSISVVENKKFLEGLPVWLSAEQVGSFESESNMLQLKQSMAQILRNPALGRMKTVLHADPGSIVWLRSKTWADQSRAQFDRELRLRSRVQAFVSFDSDDALDGYALNLAARATLVVALLDGTEADAFVHFACGAIVANPKSGVGRHRLTRHVLLLIQDEGVKAKLVAKSLMHCVPSVRVVHPNSLLQEAIPLLEHYKQWFNPPPKKE